MARRGFSELSEFIVVDVCEVEIDWLELGSRSRTRRGLRGWIADKIRAEEGGTIGATEEM